MIGLTSSALAHRIPENEKVADLVISASYSVLGRWRETYEEMDFNQAADILEKMGAEHLANRTWGTLSEGERKRSSFPRAWSTRSSCCSTAGRGLTSAAARTRGYLGLALDPMRRPSSITHHVEEILRFTHAMLLDDGGVVAQTSSTTCVARTCRGVPPVHRVDRIDGRFSRRAPRGAPGRGTDPPGPPGDPGWLRSAAMQRPPDPRWHRRCC